MNRGPVSSTYMKLVNDMKVLQDALAKYCFPLTTTHYCVFLVCCPGVDNPGHPHIKTVGLVACDEECYEVFKDLFDPGHHVFFS